jgi:hypothetical protein
VRELEAAYTQLWYERHFAQDQTHTVGVV